MTNVVSVAPAGTRGVRSEKPENTLISLLTETKGQKLNCKALIQLKSVWRKSGYVDGYF